MTPPNMMRPSNINRSKVPVPSYKAIQAANRAAAEQVDAKNSEKRGILSYLIFFIASKFILKIQLTVSRMNTIRLSQTILINFLNDVAKENIKYQNMRISKRVSFSATFRRAKINFDFSVGRIKD